MTLKAAIRVAAGASQVEYDDDFHVYKIDGVAWPSVTQILSVVESLAHIDPKILQKAALRGTKVHKLCERLFNEPEIRADCEDADEAWLNARLYGYRQFLADYEPEILAQETTVAHPLLRYCGRADLIALIRDPNAPPKRQGARYVSMIDIKTGMKSRTWGPQIAAYAHAVTEPKITHRYALKLGDGVTTPPYELVPYEDMAGDLQLFVSALNIWRWKTQR